jgi:transcriptional regulator with XRE-family HTH domain
MAAAENPAPAPDTDLMRQALGRHVRRLRAARSLTIRALATQADVTSGFISQVENGQVTPSIPTLYRIAGALGVRMSELFDALPSPSHERVLARSERTVIEAAPGTRDEILSLDPSRQLEVVLSELEPGTGTGPELSTHGAAVEFVYVLEGELVVEVPHAVYRLGPTDALTFSGEMPHAMRNGGDTLARFFWASTPASF